MLDLHAFDPLPATVNKSIVVTGVRHHAKASEAYADVVFQFPDGSKWGGSVPVNYRRTGVDATTRAQATDVILQAYLSFEPDRLKKFQAEAKKFWDGSNKDTTRPFFDVLLARLGRWVCQGHELPANPNWARRVQDIKEFGFTLASHPNRSCKACAANKSHLMLLPIPQGAATGYETLPPALRRRIIDVLASYDAYEGRTAPSASLLPDHKFPEIRWDANTLEDNPAEMSDAEIRAKFQLLSNQRNEQKREVCRTCFQTSKRGSPFGIKYYAHGKEEWPANSPKQGAEAEPGCLGCGWYDVEAWRRSLSDALGDLPKGRP